MNGRTGNDERSDCAAWRRILVMEIMDCAMRRWTDWQRRRMWLLLPMVGHIPVRREM